MSWNKQHQLDTLENEVLVINDLNYTLQTWGSLLQERFFDNDNEISRELISLKDAKIKFKNNDYLLTLNNEEDLPNYGDDFC
jgi:hypothetical protein